MITINQLNSYIFNFVKNVKYTYNIDLTYEAFEIEILDNNTIQISEYYKPLERWFTTEIKL